MSVAGFLLAVGPGSVEWRSYQDHCQEWAAVHIGGHLGRHDLRRLVDSGAARRACRPDRDPGRPDPCRRPRVFGAWERGEELQRLRAPLPRRRPGLALDGQPTVGSAAGVGEPRVRAVEADLVAEEVAA